MPQFIKDFLRNLGLLLVIGVVLFLVAPDMMRQVFQLYGLIFGPVIVLILVVAALPRKKQSKRK